MTYITTDIAKVERKLKKEESTVQNTDIVNKVKNKQLTTYLSMFNYFGYTERQNNTQRKYEIPFPFDIYGELLIQLV